MHSKYSSNNQLAEESGVQKSVKGNGDDRSPHLGNNPKFSVSADPDSYLESLIAEFKAMNAVDPEENLQKTFNSLGQPSNANPTEKFSSSDKEDASADCKRSLIEIKINQSKKESISDNESSCLEIVQDDNLKYLDFLLELLENNEDEEFDSVTPRNKLWDILYDHTR